MNAAIYEILAEAGNVLKAAYHLPPSSHEKKRFDLVTETDIEIERFLVDRLKKAFKGDGFIGEECGIQTGDTGRIWIIDPIDGTTNFIMGKPYFAISIALEQAGQITEGYVYNPICDELYYSTKDLKRSFLNEEVISVSKTKQIEQSLVVFGFSAKIKAIEQYYQDWRVLFESCRKGVGWTAPALTLCNVARGRTDIFIDSGASMHGQAAAGFILTNAGGRLFNYDMSSYHHRSKGIIASNPKLADTLQSL